MVLVVGMLALPALALASIAPPKSGHWKVTGEGVGNGGTFRISNKYVYDVTMPGVNCNLGNLSVEGRQKLRLVSEGGYSNWVIGTADPMRKNPNDISGVVGLPVKVRVGGKKMSARLEITFAILNHSDENDGVLTVNGCDIPFDAVR
jgi:hypothetical protein